ncbi:MAG TPA: murein biosynthesis integral membrane protein MurJ [Mycobacteriales bacterium]|nr:murein biosynthesis integral membrane protein MurJ [Mycobacteriales bacterium]
MSDYYPESRTRAPDPYVEDDYYSARPLGSWAGGDEPYSSLVLGRWNGERIVTPEEDRRAAEPPPIKPSSQLYSVRPRGGVRPVGPSQAPDDPIQPSRSEPRADGPQRRGGEPSLARSSRIMAIASATSRITGFVRQIALTSAIGLMAVSDAYNTANYLPNIVYELLLGGVLTSIVVPLLVHAQRNEPDGGDAYAQRLVSLATVVLGIATVLAILAAPLLVHLFGISGHNETRVASGLARLLLPEIVFYGVGAMFGAILNTRGVYGPPMWTPVLNNCVVIFTALIFFVMPGPHTLDIGTMTSAQILVLGIGTTLGIVAQTVALIPYIRKVGFHWKWRFDLRGSGLKADGGLLLWVVGYVVVSQIGLATIVHLSNSAGQKAGGIGYAVYANVSLLFQMPYGIVGVALLTALLPRMSRAAAAGNMRSLIDDLSLGSRLTAVALIPVTAAFIVLGPSITITIFAHGRTSIGSAHSMGVALAWSAFGLLPYAMTLLQLRAFYAVKDARTPTLINIGIVAVRVALSFIVPAVLPAHHVVAGLAVVNSLSFVVGLVLGDLLLRRRFGSLGSERLLRTAVQVGVASVVGGLVAWVVLLGITHELGSGRAGSTLAAVLGCLLGGVVAIGVALRMRVEDLDLVTASIRRQLGR